jgi:MGT family glycosyltransferase
MRYLSWRYGIEYIPPIDEVSYTDPNCIKLVSTFPQFQPRHHLFSKNFKFIGSCFDDKLRVLNTNDAVLQRILSKYPPKNPIEHKLRILSDKALIYIALGTVFNQNLGLYKKIISAIELLKGEKLSLKFENIDFLISAGIVFEELRKTEKSSNIHIMKSAPQLEILKRASLFVTHCGMNSMNETIYFGVPTVCIPLAEDQPMVAHRAVELGIGIYVDFVDMKPIVLKNAIRDVLENNCYREKAFEWSTETRKYTGKINGADEVMAFLKNKKM